MCSSLGGGGGSDCGVVTAFWRSSHELCLVSLWCLKYLVLVSFWHCCHLHCQASGVFPTGLGFSHHFISVRGGGGGEEVDLLMHVWVGGGLFFLMSWGLGPQGFNVTQVVRGLLGWGGRFEELSAVQWDWLCAGVSC